MFLNMEQRRRSSRWACSGEAGIVLSMELPTMPARIADLSAEGCLLIAKQPIDLAREAKVELVFTINQLPFRVRALVKVIRLETTYGFQFLQLSNRSQQRLAELLEELEEDHRTRMRGSKKSVAGFELS